MNERLSSVARPSDSAVRRPSFVIRLISSFILHPSSFLFLAFLLLYTLTLSPGLLPADAGEYQVVGAMLGVAHPPGFALYTVMSWLISRVPGVSPATAINWLSALLAAGTLALLSRAVAVLTRSRLAGAGAALALGASTTFWAQATTANIRMPAAFATAWALERLLAYRASLRQDLAGLQRPARSAGSALALFALALGLGVAHHASLAFIAVVFLLYALWLKPAALRRPWPLLAGALPFLAWLYFPLRAGAFGAPARIATLDGFLEHVLARGFKGDLFFFANPAALPERLRVFANVLSFEFVGPVLALMAVGLGATWWRGRYDASTRQMGLVLLAAVALHVFVALTYRAPQTVEYLLPAYVLMAAWVGYGLAELLRAVEALPLPASSEPLALAGIGLAMLMAVALQFAATAPSYWALAHDDGTRSYAEAVLQAAPPGSAVLASWHWATPLWYLQHVEGARPDVDVRYVFPSSESLAEDWAGQIATLAPERPVVVTSYYAQEYQALPYRFEPLGPAWQVLAGPQSEPPPGLAGAQMVGAWSFLGFRVDSVGPEAVRVTAAWQGLKAPEDVSFYVHLLDPASRLVSQMDIPHPGGRYQAGEVLVDRYTLALRPDAPAGSYRLEAGAYRPSGEVLATVPLGTVAVPPQPRLGPPAPAGAVPLGNTIWFAGSEISPAGAVRPGQTLSVRLRFVAARPITADYTVSVALGAADGRWRAQSDGTPADGAIPTLKWIAGSRVTDTRTLAVPADAQPGPAQLTLVLYDSFTQQNLPILDPELAARGPALVLGSVEIAP